MTKPTKKDLLGAALTYAGMGWQVIPVHTPRPGGCSCTLGDNCGKQAGKHPRISRWPVEATTDEKKIRGWWKDWPNANIGIVSGIASGLVVLDVDPRHDGDVSLRKLEKQHGTLPVTHKVATGGGGTHFYFKHPDGTVQNKVKVDGQEGLDIRADAGYVVAPPSLHANGERYRWEHGSTTSWVAPLPEWLHLMIQGPQPAAKAAKTRRSRNGGRGKSEFNDGERNAGLFSIAGVLRRWGAGETMIYAALSGINAECCNDPLEDEEVERIARSISGYDTGG